MTCGVLDREDPRSVADLGRDLEIVGQQPAAEALRLELQILTNYRLRSVSLWVCQCSGRIIAPDVRSSAGDQRGSSIQSGPDALAQSVARVARLSRNVRQPNHVVDN